MAVPSWVGPAISVGGALLGGKKGKESGRTATRAGETAAEAIIESWAEAEGIYNEYFNRALEALEQGDAEFAEDILKGLGLSNEEVDKAMDVAVGALEWIVDFGKAGIDDYQGYMREARDYMAYHKKLIFNPDAIYGTQAYQSIKKRTEQEWDNYYSGKGILGGTAQEALADRMFQLGAGFRQSELTNALAGAQANQGLAGTELSRIGLGARGSSQIADTYLRGGLQKAANIMGAYGAIADAGLRLNPAPLIESGGKFLSGGTYGSGQAAAEAILAGALGQSAAQSNMGNALITGALGIAGGIDWGDLLSRTPTTPPSSGFGGYTYSPMTTTPYGYGVFR
jgi:hypothetical protein